MRVALLSVRSEVSLDKKSWFRQRSAKMKDLPRGWLKRELAGPILERIFDISHS